MVKKKKKKVLSLLILLVHNQSVTFNKWNTLEKEIEVQDQSNGIFFFQVTSVTVITIKGRRPLV